MECLLADFGESAWSLYDLASLAASVGSRAIDSILQADTERMTSTMMLECVAR